MVISLELGFECLGLGLLRLDCGMHSCIAACNMLSKIFQASHAERLQYITVYPAPKRGQNSAHVCCAQTAGWIKMSLGVQVGLDLSDIVLPGDPAPLPTKGAQLPPIFGPCLLWPNGCMDQDATWYGGRPRPRPHCARW